MDAPENDPLGITGRAVECLGCGRKGIVTEVVCHSEPATWAQPSRYLRRAKVTFETGEVKTIELPEEWARLAFFEIQGIFPPEPYLHFPRPDRLQWLWMADDAKCCSGPG